MNTHVMTLFSILNLKDLTVNYRLIEIIGLVGNLDDDDTLDRNLNLLVKKVAFDTKNPVALVRRDNHYYLATQHDLKLPVLKYTLTPDVATLTPLPKCYELDFSKLTQETVHIALSFLSFALRTPLMDNGGLWRAAPSTFYSKTSVNFKDDRRETDVFQGFSFRLHPVDGKVYLAVQISYKYVDRLWLTDRCQVGQINGYRMKHVLYHFGQRWYPVQILGLTGKSIEEQEFDPDDGSPTITVLEYTRKKVGPKPPNWIQMLDPKSPAINYKYPGNEKRRYGALALCKLIHTTDDPNTKYLHRMSIKPPYERLPLTVQIVKQHFQHAKLNGIQVRISTEPFEVQPKIFPVPDLVFGQEHILKVRKPNNSDGVLLKELGRARMDCLLNPNIGALITTGFDAQYLIAPLTLNRSIVEDFSARFEKTIQQFVHGPYRTELITYDDTTAKTLKRQLDAIITAVETADINRGHAILILPPSPKESLHNFVKRKLIKDHSLLCQCVLADNLLAFYETINWEGKPMWVVKKHLEGQYISYLRYTALGHLIVNRKWPWALKTPLNYDVHIGLDVLGNTAAFTFLYKGGHHCYIRLAESKQQEKLLPQQIRTEIYTHLKEDFAEWKQECRSVVIHRDGRAYADEWKGFQAAIRDLKREKLLPDNVIIGIVEVHKHSSSKVRLIAKREGHFVNPIIGGWEPLGEREGIVCTTGYPFISQGTVNPIHIRIAYGELELTPVLQDEFSLSQLCWMVPDRCCRLPIPIQLSDDFLRPVAAKAADDEAEYGEEIDSEEWTDSIIDSHREMEVLQ